MAEIVREVTVEEWAEAKRLHPETVRKWARWGRIPGARKMGRVWRIRADEAVPEGLQAEGEEKSARDTTQCN